MSIDYKEYYNQHKKYYLKNNYSIRRIQGGIDYEKFEETGKMIPKNNSEFFHKEKNKQINYSYHKKYILEEMMEIKKILEILSDQKKLNEGHIKFLYNIIRSDRYELVNNTTDMENYLNVYCEKVKEKLESSYKTETDLNKNINMIENYFKK